MIWEHSRFEIWNHTQHPLKHSFDNAAYSNEGLPGVSTVEGALNWVVKVLYPNVQPNVPTPGDLPTVGNTVNDYRVVDDDGDGNSAGYRWEQREGDVTYKWYKVFDVDWSTDAILAAVTDVTNDMYVYQQGKSDLDSSGDIITGVFAGQRIWGGNLTNQNLTLDANSVDETGYVQVNSDFRPTVDSNWDLGTATERFLNGYISGFMQIDTLTVTGGSITDSTGSINFDNEDLTTTGAIEGTILRADNGANLIEIDHNSIISDSGAISFGNNDLNTTGDVSCVGGIFSGIVDIDTSLIFSNATAAGSITSAFGSIDFDDEDLLTTGVVTAGQLDIDNIRIDGNQVSVTDTDGNLTLAANGTGIVNILTPLTTIGITTTGTVGITGLLNVDNVRIDGNSIRSTSGDFLISSDGGLYFSDTLIPNGTIDLGNAVSRFQDIYLSNGIQDGTNSMLIADLMNLRNVNYRDSARTQPAQTGDSLFFDLAAQEWLASAPDTEISHTLLSNLTVGDAGHTQFALLAGRSGGQSLIGGISASENLTLESTSNASKGGILFRDNLRPAVDNTTDIGSATERVKDLYMSGQGIGFRAENATVGTLPASSALNVGRLVFATDTNKTYVDTGAGWLSSGASKFAQDIAFNGIITSIDVNVSSSITDARLAIIQLLDNSNDFERVYCTIKATSASNVRVETNVALPAGSYRLVVIE